MAEWLVFVDTNIFLDFYRLRGASALKYLERLEENRESLILTEQVNMEFLKHRQRVVRDALSEIKKPTEQKFPPFVSEYQPSKMMEKSISEAVTQHRKIIAKIEGMINDPSRYDDVYKSFVRLFRKDGLYHLDRNREEKNRIRSSARKRFSLGYPPRKNGDNSIGDSLNWEWIIWCAQNCPEKRDIIIVSRDGDFGTTLKKKGLINDWLRKEFQERVSKKRKTLLTEYLSEALEKLDTPLSSQEIEEEREIVSQSFRPISETTLQSLRNALSQYSNADSDFARRLAKQFEGINSIDHSAILRALHGDD